MKGGSLINVTMEYVLIFFCMLVFSTGGASYKDFICPNGFVRYYRSCYKFSSLRATWLDAHSYCQAIGASLVSIEDRKEDKFLISYVKQHRETYPKSFWTGGNDLANEGEWHWVGSLLPLTYRNWYLYQPDNGRQQEHCMELERRYGYRWNDQPCHLLNHFICETYMY